MAAVLVLLSLLSGAELAGSTDDRQAVLDSLLVLNRTAGPEAVAELVGRHLPSARAAGDSFFVMRLVGIRGGSLAFHGQNPRAIADLEESLALACALGDSFSVARTLVWLANGYEQLGRQAESSTAYARLAVLGDHLQNPFFAGRGLIGTAWARRQAGRHTEAESLYTRGGALAWAAEDTFAALWSENGLGLCQWDQGQLARADSTFQAVMRRSRLSGQRRVEAAALNNHAGLMEVLGRPDAALGGYLASRDLQLQDGNLREAIPAALNVARCQLQLGRLAEATATLEGILADCRQAGFRDFEAAALDHLASVQLAENRPARAAATARQALAGQAALQPRHAVQLQLTLARSLAARDSLTAALATTARATDLAAALGEVHLQVDAALLRGDLLLRTGAADAAAEVLVAALEPTAAGGFVPLRLALLSQAGRAYLAAGAPEPARDHLLAALAFWEDARTLPTDPAWRERRSGSARHLFEHLAAVTLAHPADQPAAVRQARAFDLLQHYKARTLLERSLGPGRDLAPPRPVTLEQLQRETLRDGEVLMDLYLGEQRGLLFVVAGDTLLVQVLRSRREVGEILAAVDGLLRAGGPRPPLDEIHRLLASLGQAPAEGRPLLALLTAARALFWSPDGAAHRLPVAAILPSGGATVTHIPSATFLANLRSGDAPTDAHARAARQARILAAAGGSDHQGRPLPGAAAELDWLQRRFASVSVLADTAASAAAAIQQAAPIAILHLAAHAEIDGQRPWNSGIMLGREDRPRWLRASDVAGLDRTIQLAVLASCGTGDGAVLAGEGLVGIATGFLAGGTSAVLATLWPVTDQDAQLFSSRFYEELAAGATAAAAVQRAQRWLRSRPETADPQQWAAYVLWGDGDQTFALSPRPRRWSWPFGAAGAPLAAVVALAAIGLLALLIQRPRRRR